MLRITIQCGIERDKDNGFILEYDRVRARALIVDEATNTFGGVTLSDTYGGWKDDSGKQVIERGWSISILSEDNQRRADEARVFALLVKRLLKQASVVLTLEAVNAEFV